MGPVFSCQVYANLLCSNNTNAFGNLITGEIQMTKEQMKNRPVFQLLGKCKQNNTGKYPWPGVSVVVAVVDDAIAIASGYERYNYFYTDINGSSHFVNQSASVY